jgi:signal transduction histidine kinase
MKLSDFLRSHAKEILCAWDEFASTVEHVGKALDQRALRDHAAQILQAIAADLDRPQSDAQQIAKSRGETDRAEGSADSAAETHADTRIQAGFAIDAMITEYRALRASVLRMWAADKHGDVPREDELRQLTRFNEAIDQALAESVARYTEQVRHYTNLFMGMLGHDIRNPLGTIRLSAQLLIRRGDLTADAAAPIVNSARRIQDIVELIVDFSRAQADGAMPVHPVPCDLGRLVRDVVEETRVRHPLALMEIEVAEEHGEWDKGRIGQLLSNLLQNALSYGSRTETVTVRLKGHPDVIALSVNNRGPIIPFADRERLFEPRARGTNADEERAPEGLGLGLYICREIVKAHGGTLSLTSNAIDGTTFTAQLPRVATGTQTAESASIPGQ